MKTSDELIRTLGRELVETIAPYWNGGNGELLNEVIATVLLAVLNSHNGSAARQLNGEFACQLGTSIRDVQRQYAFQILLQLNGNKAQAARMLGIDRGSLSRLLEGTNLLRFKSARKPNRLATSQRA